MRMATKFTTALAILGCVLALSNAKAFAEKPAKVKQLEILPTEKDEVYAKGNMRINKETQIPTTLYAVNYRVNPASPEEMARQYLRENAEKLHLKADLSDIVFSSNLETPGGQRVRFFQKVGQYPVYKATLTVSLDRRNQVVFVMNQYKPVGKFDDRIMITKEDAAQRTKSHLGISTRQAENENTETILYYNKGVMRLVQKVSFSTRGDLRGDWEALVDAQTGEIVRLEDRILYSGAASSRSVAGSGWVFDPDPVSKSKGRYGEGAMIDNNDADSAELTALLSQVAIEVTLENGMHYLKGQYAVISDHEAPTTGLYGQAGMEFHYTRSNDAFEAVNVYYHIDKTMRYLNETLGFEVMPFQYEGGVQFDPNGVDGDANAHYTHDGQVAFGSPDGAVDTGEDHAIVIHEMGHAIHDYITNGELSQVDGLSEGSSDYWAQSYTRSFGIYAPTDEGYDWFGQWGIQPLGDFSLRQTNYPGHYPEDLVGQIHTDGQMWSSSMMSIYDLVGRTVSDRIFWEGLSMTDGSASQVDAALAVMQADKNLYNGAHLRQMIDVFKNRGYIPGAIIADVAADVTGGKPSLTVHFTDASYAVLDPITSWEWDFDSNGTIDSRDKNPTWTYTTPGLYSVTLTASNATDRHTYTEVDLISVNGGIFIWDAAQSPAEFSGDFIKGVVSRFDNLKAVKSRSAGVPSSLVGYDVAFLSFGNPGNTRLDGEIADAVREYLKSGGKLYLEGGDAALYDLDSLEEGRNRDIMPLIGLAGGDDGDNTAPNFINSLAGQTGTLAAGMTFTSSQQIGQFSVDRYIPSATAKAAFNESGYGTVAVQYTGDFGQKTFCSAYSLGLLNDRTSPHTRGNLFLQMLFFFGQAPAGAKIADFGADTRFGKAPLNVTFSDLSAADAADPITTWSWDFDSNGTPDATTKSPLWVFSAPGTYKVTLTVSNRAGQATVTKEQYLTVVSSTTPTALAFDGIAGSLSCVATPVLNLRNAITVEACIYPTGWGLGSATGFGRIFDKTQILWFLNGEGHPTYADHSMIFTLTQTGAGTPRFNTPAGVIKLNEWQHVAVTFMSNPPAVQCFVNGNEIPLTNVDPDEANQLIAATITSSATDAFVIGNRTIGARCFQGTIDNVNVWNRALTQDEIKGLMTKQLVGTESGLVGFWPMEEGRGKSTDDVSVNSSVGTITSAVWNYGCPIGVGIEDGDDTETLPAVFALYQNRPNPFNPSTTIAYALPASATVKLKIYNVAGQLVKTLVNHKQDAGQYELQWNGTNEQNRAVAGGVYLYQLEADNKTIAGKRMVLLK